MIKAFMLCLGLLFIASPSFATTRSQELRTNYRRHAMSGYVLLSTVKNMANHITAMPNGTTRQKLAFALAEKAGEAASVGGLFSLWRGSLLLAHRCIRGSAKVWPLPDLLRTSARASAERVGR